MIRLFIGIHLKNNKIIQAQQGLLKKLLSQNQIKWVEPKNFHITLKFLGNTEDNLVNSISHLLEEKSTKQIAFHLEYGGPGYFGSKFNPRVIWYGFKQNSDLIHLQHSMDKNLIQLGFPEDKGTYNPHLTLGRVKKISEIENFESFFMQKEANQKKKFLVEKIQLFQSNLMPTGPVYTVLEEFNLGKP